MESFRGPETQVMRVKPSARLSRSWNPDLESETQCPFIEVLKPRSSEPNTEVLKPNVLRAKCSNAGLQAWADCVRPSRVPTSLIYNFACCVRLSLRPWRSSGFRPTGPGANRRAEFPVPSLWAKLLEEIRLRHSSAERRPGIADVKNGVPGRVRSGLCVTELGNFCSREHPLREVISSHFLESFWYGRCWFWVL
jgi:hypothetical protein